MVGKDKMWNAFYKGWFAGRAGRPYPPVDSMVEHSFMVDGYDLGRRSAGRPSHAEALAAQVSGEQWGSGEAQSQTEAGAEETPQASGEEQAGGDQAGEGEGSGEAKPEDGSQEAA